MSIPTLLRLSFSLRAGADRTFAVLDNVDGLQFRALRCNRIVVLWILRGCMMAMVFLVYGPRGSGKTSAVVELGEAISELGIDVGGFYQHATYDELDRRGYDIVRFRDRSVRLLLARPGGMEKPGVSAICSYSFSQQVLAEGRSWLEHDACRNRVLIIDEISKLEARGEGHADALRWALSLGDDKLLLLSVRADQLFYVVEAFDLGDRVVGYVESPTTSQNLAVHAEWIANMLAGLPAVTEGTHM